MQESSWPHVFCEYFHAQYCSGMWWGGHQMCRHRSFKFISSLWLQARFIISISCSALRKFSRRLHSLRRCATSMIHGTKFPPLMTHPCLYPSLPPLPSPMHTLIITELALPNFSFCFQSLVSAHVGYAHHLLKAHIFLLGLTIFGDNTLLDRLCASSLPDTNPSQFSRYHDVHDIRLVTKVVRWGWPLTCSPRLRVLIEYWILPLANQISSFYAETRKIKTKCLHDTENHSGT